MIYMIFMSVDCLCINFFFFFKQKTAYEMRISDWSSDVCSSDLDDRDRPCLSLLVFAAGTRRGARGGEARGTADPVRRPLARPRSVRGAARRGPEIGRASCRERVCQYV